MNPSAVMGRVTGLSPRTTARLVGVLYLLTMVLGGYAQSLAGRLVIVGNAGATAANILTHEPLFRFGFAVYLVEMACQIAMTVLFYGLLKPVSRSGALLAAAFGLVGCGIKTIGRLFYFAPLLVLGDARYLSVFSPEQLRALALLFLRVNYMAETIAMVFFGCYALVQGYLIFRSGFLPPVLGVLSAVGGLAWLTHLHEPLAARLVPVILGIALLGALAKTGWLLVFGVNEQRWREQAGAVRL